jgi:hypothetical protein
MDGQENVTPHKVTLPADIFLLRIWKFTGASMIYVW